MQAPRFVIFCHGKRAVHGAAPKATEYKKRGMKRYQGSAPGIW
jgi:hypothetical protein